MSRIGKTPVEIKEGTSASLSDGVVTISGPKGSLSYTIPKNLSVKIENDNILVSTEHTDDAAKALFGLTRATIANMVKGVVDGFEKKLELIGVGYRASVSGDELTLSLGFSHPIKIKAPEGVLFSVAENVITVSGSDKALVGNTAAKIRLIRPPEPYKGKGIRYIGEKVRRKAGKAAKAVGVK